MCEEPWREPDEDREQQEARDQERSELTLFEMTASHVCQDLKYLMELSDRLGLLSNLQRIAVGAAWVALDEQFPKPDHQNERSFMAPLPARDCGGDKTGLHSVRRRQGNEEFNITVAFFSGFLGGIGFALLIALGLTTKGH